MKFTAKTAGYVGLISLLVISLIFMKGEWGNFDCQADFNIPKWTSYFTCIGAMGTAITVIYLAFQLQEMKDARLGTVKPWLFTENFYFDIEEQALTNKNETKTFIYPKGFIIDSTVASIVKIFNYGRGLAKDIKIKWEFSLEEVSKLKPEDVAVGYTQIPSTNIVAIDVRDSANVSLPLNYLACCAPSLNESWFGNVVNNTEPKPKPKLKLYITYSDLEGKNHTTEYDVEVSAIDHTVYFNFNEIKH